MNTVAQDIKVILDGDSSLGLTFGTDLFVGLMPTTPDTCVSVIDTGGLEPTVGPYYYPTAQVLVRAGVGLYDTAASLAYSLIDKLHRYYGQPDSSSYYYTGIWAVGDPVFLGLDEANRPMFSINFRIQRR